MVHLSLHSALGPGLAQGFCTAITKHDTGNACRCGGRRKTVTSIHSFDVAPSSFLVGKKSRDLGGRCCWEPGLYSIKKPLTVRIRILPVSVGKQFYLTPSCAFITCAASLSHLLTTSVQNLTRHRHRHQQTPLLLNPQLPNLAPIHLQSPARNLRDVTQKIEL